jgi:oligoendopeptidase F
VEKTGRSLLDQSFAKPDLLDAQVLQLQDDESKSIDEFKKLVSELENLEIKIDEEDQAIFLFNSLPPAYDHLRDTIKYSKESLTPKEVSATAYLKELDLKLNGNLAKRNGEALNVQERKCTGFVIKNGTLRRIVHKETRGG